jgi:predicted Holliday junction resolvase-like endonuclease
MYKIINLFFLIIIFLFFLNIYKYYSSNKNIKNINLNRSNIEEILKTKISNIPILENDTNNVIEFNSSFSEEIKDNKSRSFWNLLKIE